MNFADMQEPKKNSSLGFLDKRWERLNAWFNAEWENAAKYLFLTNAGGAVAVLSFLGASKDLRGNCCLALALLAFAVGVILLGAFRAHLVHKSADTYVGWAKDADLFVTNQLTWEKLIENHERRAAIGAWGYIFGYASFTCFILGVVCGGFALFFGTA